MPKNASTAALKWAQRAGSASSDYEAGVMNTTKDQAGAAIAAKGLYQQGVTEAISRGAYEKGLQKSGKAGWQKGVQEKGSANFATGVMAPSASSSYASESGRFDSARNAATSSPRGPKGSPANLNRVALVANALRAVKIGK